MQVSELSDLDADVLDLLSALWVQQARSPNDVAKVSVKNLLRMRGLKPKTGAGGRSSGFRPDQKQQLFRSLAHIQNIYLLIQDMELPGSERDSGRHKESREVRSRAFIITDIAGKRTENGPLDIEEFLIRPGVLFGYFLFGHGRQIALLSAKAIEYDRIRQDWENVWLVIFPGNGAMTHSTSVAAVNFWCGRFWKIRVRKPTRCIRNEPKNGWKKHWTRWRPIK